MKISMSCDDGCASDVKVALLADKYEIPCVFYWPVEWHSLAYDKGYKPLNFFEAYDIACDYEVGAHTITHRHLTKIPLLDAKREIYDCKEVLERLFDVQVTKFCPPRGYTNKDLDEYVYNIYESQRLTKGDGLVHVHPDSGANDNMPWQEAAKGLEEVELWFHSWELDKFNLWQELEDFLSENTRS